MLYAMFVYLLVPEGKRRRAAADFPGASIILRQLKEKPLTKRVGFTSSGPPARGEFHFELLKIKLFLKINIIVFNRYYVNRS